VRLRDPQTPAASSAKRLKQSSSSPSKIKNQTSTIVIRKSPLPLLPRHPPFNLLLPPHRTSLIHPACASPPLQLPPLHFDVRRSPHSSHPCAMSVIWG
jgi:hypothetical protein